MAPSLGAFWNKQLTESSLAPLLARFWAWERAGFFALFEPQTLARLMDRGDRKFVLRAGKPSKELEPAGSDGSIGPITSEELRAASLSSALARRGLRREATSIALEIDRPAFFIRRLDVPTAARSNLARLLAADMERKTPFKPDAVFVGHIAVPHPRDPGKLQVEQWILRRDLVAAALADTGLDPDDIDLIQSVVEGPTIALRAAAAPDDTSGKIQRLALGLCAATVVFFVAGAAITLWRQDSALADIEGTLAEASTRAAKVRKIADRATAESRVLTILREERAKHPTLADVLEEVSRLLPDSVYVTDLRLSEDNAGDRTLDLNGLAASAVGLPVLFDKSRVLSDATLTSAIMPDPQQKREGFSLQAKIRSSRAKPK